MADAKPIGVEAFEPAFRQSDSEPAWLAGFRKAGADRFSAAGLPTNRNEAWKYTSLRPLARAKYQLASVPTDTPDVPAPLLERAAQAVFINGAFQAALSTLDELGGAVGRWSEHADAPWLRETASGHAPLEQQMYALNAAAFEDGLTLRLGDGEALARPLEILHISDAGDAPTMWHPRFAFDLGEGASAAVLERHVSVGASAYLANHAGDIRLAKGARLVHAKVQEEAAEGRHLAMTRVRVGEAALYDNFTLTLGAGLSRNETAVRLEGEAAETRLNGAYAISGRQHADHTSRIDQLAENTVSRQVYAGAIDGNARGVFQGHIVVEREGQGTDGHQLNRALMLSDHAEIDSKPVLEIYADDVKCSHGATAGDIDPDQLFYLRGRGIGAETARRMLARGFLAEAAEGLSDDAVRQVILAALDRVWGLENAS